MSNHANKSTIDLHHNQVKNAKLKRLKREYDRNHRKELHRRELKSFAIAWECLKGIIVACLFTSLISSVMYCLYSLFGGL